MRSERFMLLIFGAMSLTSNTKAQTYTYNHDATKMNQITIMELGTGSFSPEVYYTLFHSNYKKSAAQKNKMSFRTLAGISSYTQVDYAEAIDSALTNRAKIEALNVADRSGGTLDVAWLAEREKILEKLESFQKNINRIVPSGGTANDRKRWNEYYELFQCAVKATRDAYMPNSQRKKQYLRIYEDISKQNDLLIRQLVKMSNADKTKELLSASHSRSVNVGSIASSAFSRWRNVGLTTVTSD